MAPFVIYALPRSRTAWLSKFLSYGKWTCGHDVAVDLHSIAALRAFFALPNIGSAETAMVDGWLLVQTLVPDIRSVVVRRPILDVYASFHRLGIPVEVVSYQLNVRNRLLNEAQNAANAITVHYDDLDEEDTCKRIFEHCLQEKFDRDWWLSLKDENIQIDMTERLKKIERNRPGIQALKGEVAALLTA
jgi:hypothetical protein